jgi:uncharacterized protein (TIGR02266 family)
VSSVRQHPRFIDENAVEVEYGSREALKEAWTVDISKGGMFIRTETPPPFGTRLSIRFSSPDGTLALDADVVHVVDAEAAKTFGQPAGVGVQFVDLSAEVRQRFEAYVDGVAQRLTDDLAEPEREYETLDVLLADARRLMDELQASRLYAALEVDPGASRDEIELRVQMLCERFASPPPDSPPPKVARLEMVARQLERASDLVANPLRRLHYDFNHGHVRAEERRAAGEDVAHLREVWVQAFPERVAKSGMIAERAMTAESHSIEEALALADEALELDPFNGDLLTVRSCWAAGKRVASAQLEGGSQDVLVPDAPAPDPAEAIMQELSALANAQPNHFELLGVGRDASADALTKAYFEKTRRYDPKALRGRVPDALLKVAVDIQAKLSTAYRTLNHAVARQSYTERLESGSTAQTPDSQATMAFEMGKVHMRKGAPGEARQLFERAHELDPENPHYAAAYAWSMINDRDLDRAQAASEGRRLLMQAIETAATTKLKDLLAVGQWHYYLGRLFREQGHAELALKNLDRALALNPHLKEARMERRLVEIRARDGEG